MRVYDHAGCKEHCEDFTVVLKMFNVFDIKEMYISVLLLSELLKPLLGRTRSWGRC